MTPGQDAVLLDVGAGDKPYLPLLAPFVRKYIGLDCDVTPNTDIAGVAEFLPCRDSCVDVVLATQVLEHVDDPTAALREWHRVLRPGGLIIASTHGSAYYHPLPVDHWRWTHSGLQKLFQDAGFQVDFLEAAERSLSVVALLLSIHVYGTASRFRLGWIASTCLAPFHFVIAALDGINSSRHANPPSLDWGSMPWSYVIAARKAPSPDTISAPSD